MSVTRTGPGLEAALKRIGSLDGVQVTLGLHGTSATTAPGEASASELVRIGADVHFGGRNQPARPFLTIPLKLRGKTWAAGLRHAVQQLARGDAAGSGVAIRQVAVKGVGDIQELMRSYGWAPNAPATIEAKGSAQPTIDSGQMRQSIRGAVEVPGRAPEVVG